MYVYILNIHCIQFIYEMNEFIIVLIIHNNNHKDLNLLAKKAIGCFQVFPSSFFTIIDLHLNTRVTCKNHNLSTFSKAGLHKGRTHYTGRTLFFLL